jgi:hypothetical protein
MEILTSIFIFGSSFIGNVWQLIILLLSLINIKLFRVNGQKLQQFSNTIKIASIWNNNEPESWVIGYWYIGYIQSTESMRGKPSKSLLLLCRSVFYENMINFANGNSLDSNSNYNHHGNSNSNSNSKTKHIVKTVKTYERTGSFYNLNYEPYILPITNMVERQAQKKAINTILNNFKQDLERLHLSVLLYGKTGSGKSMISHLLVKKMIKMDQYKEVTLVDTFNPTDPGDNLCNMYHKINPSINSPLIIVLEEIDNIIDRMHNQSIIRHQDISIEIKDKSNWNTFFDKFNRSMYKNVIFIMTTNKSIEYFNDLDESYFRDGRVNLKIAI